MQWPLTVPVAATALRPTLDQLPAKLRNALEDRLGAPIRKSESQGSGYTQGFASRLVLTDGRRVFVKAASDEYPWMVEAYANEAIKLRLLPDSVPAPRLVEEFTVRAERDWLVLIFDDIDGAPPVRPWRLSEAGAALGAAEAMAQALTPPPIGYRWISLAEEIDDLPHRWDQVPGHGPWLEQIGELADLDRRSAELLAGRTLVHWDLRDDNVIFDRSGQAWFCDWNFPVVGPAWADSVCLAISMHGDGLDVESMISPRMVTNDDREAVDCLLATLSAYFLISAAQPHNPTSPWLRRHQAWYAQVTWDWLCRRRRW